MNGVCCTLSCTVQLQFVEEGDRRALFAVRHQWQRPPRLPRVHRCRPAWGNPPSAILALPHSTKYASTTSTKVRPRDASALRCCDPSHCRRLWRYGVAGWRLRVVFQDYDAAEHPLGKSSTKTPGPWSMELLAQKYCSHTDCSVSYPLLPILSAKPRGRASSRARACAHRYRPCGGVEPPARSLALRSMRTWWPTVCAPRANSSQSGI